MNKDVSLLWLLLQGQLPPSLFSEGRFHHLIPAVQAVIYFSERGETAPYDGRRVWSVARERFNAQESLKESLQAATVLQPDRPLLRAVQERLLYEKTLDLVTKQLESGAYNPSAIVNLLEKHADADAIPIHKLALPSSDPQVRFICRTGIPHIDTVIGGVGKELIIVAAPPKNGKSNFFINMVARQPPAVDVLYITVQDYSREDLNRLINVAKPGLAKVKENLYIVDLTGYSATLNEVENVVKRTKTEGVPLLTVVDRAEKLRCLGKYDNETRMYDEIFTGLRRVASRYETVVFTDSQLGYIGQDILLRDGAISSRHIYGDHTQRQAIMDIFIGVRRNDLLNPEDHSVTLFMEGRRQGKLPASVTIPCNQLGVYQ